jgi:hypothetical protein
VALRNRKYVESIRLKGVNHVDDETDVELGSFTTLQNYIPAEVYAIKKKRGVDPLSPTALEVITTEAGDPITTESGDPLETEL